MQRYAFLSGILNNPGKILKNAGIFVYFRLPEYLCGKMEYNFKQIEAADMCLRIISVIAGKYIDQVLVKTCRLELSFIIPHEGEAGKKIIIEVSKEADVSIKAIPLSSVKYGEGDVWTFIEKYLPDYYHRDDILQHDICSRYVDNEDVCESNLQWIYKDFGSDREKVKVEIEQMEKNFAYEALTNWLDSHGPDSW